MHLGPNPAAAGDGDHGVGVKAEQTAKQQLGWRHHVHVLCEAWQSILAMLLAVVVTFSLLPAALYESEKVGEEQLLLL
jgi:hypothetical protein